MARLRSLLFLGLLLGSLFVGERLLSQTPTQPPPLFIVGRTYLVIPDCLPMYLVQMAESMPMFRGVGLNPCYAERLTVVSVRPDGWVQMVEDDGDAWTINPARVYAVQLQPLPAPTVRQ